MEIWNNLQISVDFQDLHGHDKRVEENNIDFQDFAEREKKKQL